MWRRVRKAVTLSIPLRAPDVLSRLLNGLRSGSISDEMWALYLTRVMRPNDERLKAPPFSTSPTNVIVHRHNLRQLQSYRNAETYCRTKGLRLYMVTAFDCVRSEDSRHWTGAARTFQALEQIRPDIAEILPCFWHGAEAAEVRLGGARHVGQLR